MGWLKRAYNLPLSNKGDWCALVNNLPPYQHVDDNSFLSFKSHNQISQRMYLKQR